MKSCVVLAAFFCFSLLISCATVDSDRSLLGSDYKEKDRNFFYAVKSRRDLEEVQRIKTANVNVSDRLGQTALMWACWNGDLPIIKELLGRRKINTIKKSRNDNEIVLQYNSLFAFVMSPKLNSVDGYEPEKKIIMTNDKELKEISYLNYYSLIEKLKEEDVNTTLSPNKILYQLIIKEPNILKETDSFGDTVIHKIVRSNNIGSFHTIMAALCRTEYEEMQKLIIQKKLTESKFNDIQKKIQTRELDLLDQKNGNKETPLLLAVRRQKSQITRMLIDKGVSLDDDVIFDNEKSTDKKSLLIEAFDDGNGDDAVFDELLVGKGNKSIASRQNSNIIYDGTDEYFENYIKDFRAKSKDEYASQKAHNYLNKYQETYMSILKGDNELKVEMLRDGKFDEIKVRLFSLLKKDATTKDVEDIYNILNNNRSFLTKNEDRTNKSVLQLAIENKNIEVFKKVFEIINPVYLDKLDPVGNGYGDYLIVAIVNGRTEIIDYLLKESIKRNGVINQYLMNYTSRYDKEDIIINNEPVFDPLSIYLKNFSKETIKPLDEAVIKFYENKFKNNPIQCSYILNLYMNKDISENVFNYLFNKFPDNAINPGERKKAFELIRKNLENRTEETGVEEVMKLIQEKEPSLPFSERKRP
ncbi:MAG: ankyrin repeat domain-containing protein [Prevotella sp.]|jgi:ankyrin repeat protein|nr:ankyrin repeat domain-containing protein [Prevotella sp.]